MDKNVEHLRLARGKGAVLKMRLTSLRARLPNRIIFAFEGDDDKIVYSRWIGRLRPSLRYEPFVCNGKGGVIELKKVVRRDLGNVGRGLFYFVDRDFDDLADFPDTERVFVTEKYAVENYLVASEVVDSILRDEFPCHEQPGIRAAICQLFEETYHKFLEISKPVNERLYYARKIPIRLARPLPTKLSSVAQVGLDNVAPGHASASEMVVLSREPLEAEKSDLAVEFAGIDPRARYRGKFAILFFRKWLDLLCDEYDARATGIFGSLVSQAKVRRAELSLGGFASKSALPTGLQAFLDAVPPSAN